MCVKRNKTKRREGKNLPENTRSLSIDTKIRGADNIRNDGKLYDVHFIGGI